MKEYQIYVDRKAQQMFLRSEAPITDLVNEDICVNGERIRVGNYSDLSEYFTTKLRYCGKYSHYAVFYLGNESDIFSEVHYYDLIHIVHETCIALYLQERCAATQNYNKELQRWK